MRILGIDYGKKKIGLALAEGPLSEPWKVIRFENIDDVVEELSDLVESESINKVVVGISENKMGEESKRFSLSLSKRLTIPVATFDETLTTYEAQKLAIEAGIGRKKRKEMEDAYAASLMLQLYLDSNV